MTLFQTKTKSQRNSTKQRVTALRFRWQLLLSGTIWNCIETAAEPTLPLKTVVFRHIGNFQSSEIKKNFLIFSLDTCKILHMQTKYKGNFLRKKSLFQMI